MIKKTRYLISHELGGNRHEVETWSQLHLHNDSEGFEASHYEVVKNKIVKYFKSGILKWWCEFEYTLDTATANVTFELLGHDAVEELPPIELNTVAKGFKPATAKKPKKPKAAPVQFILPTHPPEPIPVPEQLEIGAQVMAQMAQGVVDIETEPNEINF